MDNDNTIPSSQRSDQSLWDNFDPDHFAGYCSASSSGDAKEAEGSQHGGRSPVEEDFGEDANERDGYAEHGPSTQALWETVGPWPENLQNLEETVQKTYDEVEFPPAEGELDGTQTTVPTSSFTGVEKRKGLACDSSEETLADTDEPLSKKARAEEAAGGGDLALVIIADSASMRGAFDVNEVSFGAQWQLARMVSSKLFTRVDMLAITRTLGKLEGSNEETATQVTKAFLNLKGSLSDDTSFAEERLAKTPWAELDKEQEALGANPYAGIGNNDDYPDWYGGKVNFGATLRKSSDDTQFELTLDHCVLGTSCRNTRRFGSDRFLKVKIARDLYYKSQKECLEFLQRPIVMWNRVYRLAWFKDDTVHLFRTDESYVGGKMTSPTNGLSVHHFLQWANPMEYNKNQRLCKWWARFALGFSNSIPGPRLEERDIMEIDDIVSPEGSDMTDGCGLSNLKLHLMIQAQYQLPSAPSAFQCRISGNKGMLALDREQEHSERPQVWIRPSQRKIKFAPGPLDPAHLTIDLLRHSHMKSPSRLPREVIVNMKHNGVPASVFKKLLETSLAESVNPLLDWKSKDAMYKLWCEVERAEGVLRSRAAREVAEAARFRGYKHGDDEIDDGDDNGLDTFVDPAAAAWTPDYTSGCPSSLGETVLALLDSGFTPDNCAVAREKLKEVIKSVVRRRTLKFQLETQFSATALVVPDPYGVLGPDEIQIKSSRCDLKREDGSKTNLILGDVLLTRSPCKGPSDVRKVKAVEHPRLNDLVDVIVCSVRGYKRLLEFLAGGDYDGDQALVTWLAEAVKNFKNADLRYSEEPPNLMASFTTDDYSVSDFLELTKNESPANQVHELHQRLVSRLPDPELISNYASYHENAVYKYGYASAQAYELAYKFGIVMDSPKTGHHLTPLARQNDTKYKHSKGPPWKYQMKQRTTSAKDESNVSCLQRKIPSSFILDELFAAGNKLYNEWTAKVENVVKFGDPRPCPLDVGDERELVQVPPDHHLYDVYVEASMEEKRRGDLKYRTDLSTIENHVKVMYAQFKQLKRAESNNKTQKVETRQEALRKLSAKFASFPRPQDLLCILDEATIARLRASYAYHLDACSRANSESKITWSRFPWDMAMRELGLIKARALGPHKAVTIGFYERFKLMIRNS